MSFNWIFYALLLSTSFLMGCCHNCHDDSLHTVPVTNNPHMVPNVAQSLSMPGIGY